MKKNDFLNVIDKVNKKFKSIIGLACLSSVIMLINVIVQFILILRGGNVYNFLDKYMNLQSFILINIILIISQVLSSIILIFLLVKVFAIQSKIETDYNLYLHDKIDNNDEKENYKQERLKRILTSLVESKITLTIWFWITLFIHLNIIAVIFLILTRSKINSYNNIIIDSFKDQ